MKNQPKNQLRNNKMTGVQSDSSSWRLNQRLRTVDSLVMSKNKDQPLSPERNPIWDLDSRLSNVKVENDSHSSSASTVEFDFSSETHENQESPDSSCCSSRIAELDDTSDIALQSKEYECLQSFRFNDEVQPTLTRYQISKTRSLSVRRAVDETIAAIEAANLELLSRAQIAEESTRILLQQNTELKNTIDQFKRQNLPQKNRCPSSSREFSHRSRPSLNMPRNYPTVPLHQKSSSFSASVMRPKDSLDYYESKPYSLYDQQDKNYYVTPIAPERKSSSIARDSVYVPEHKSSTIARDSTYVPEHKSSSIAQDSTCDTLSQQSQPLNTPQNSSSSRLWFRRKNSTETGHAQGNKSVPTVKTPKTSSAENQSHFSHSINKISSPIPGSVQHHPVLLEGTNLSNPNRLKFISLEEARRRVKNSPPT
ncbi:hypothetical protein GcM3_029009 [Golovinomyces cichoracearum]|uniref:Uncharacterized protein n=1 Tax=Golovinomyces cichoracearum TaxID=62708 RepID=A0A420J594_9PEZI|nr:hypothetical protein GcM3_029009 [Golovinomyces cichoracearum]